MISEFDLHIHSKYSFDSILKLETIVRTAKRKGLAGVAITDHNTIQGGLLGQKYNTDDFIVIAGIEIKTELGDIIGLFLNEDIQVNRIFCAVDAIHDQGGLVILPHPFRGHDLNKFDEQLFKQFDGIEAYNSRTDDTDNKKVEELILKYKYPVVAGSDAHFAGEIGLARTIIKGDISSEKEVRNAILNNKTNISGTISPLYFHGASRIITEVKSGNFHKFPKMLIKMPIKYLCKSFKKI